MKEHVCERVDVRVVCERRPDRHRLAVVVDNVMLVPIERKRPDTALAQRLVDDVRDEREVIQVARRLVQPHSEDPREWDEPGAHHQHVAELPLALLDTHLLGVLRFDAVLPALFALRWRTFSLSESASLKTEDDGELPIAHQVVVGEGDGDGVLVVRRVVAGVVVGDGEDEGELFDGKMCRT